MSTIEVDLWLEDKTDKTDKKFVDSISIPIGPDDSLKGIQLHKDKIVVSVFRSKPISLTKSQRKKVIDINTNPTEVKFN